MRTGHGSQALIANLIAKVASVMCSSGSPKRVVIYPTESRALRRPIRAHNGQQRQRARLDHPVALSRVVLPFGGTPSRHSAATIVDLTA